MSPVTSDDAESAAVCTPLFTVTTQPLIRAGLTVIPINGKIPRDLKWQLRDYDNSAEVAAADARGHNLGVRLADSGWLVIDVDPRRGGDESFERFRSDAGIALDDYPFVRTGGGGLHVYMRLPDGFEAVAHHDHYPGIDIKTSGQVVAPGSIHPETGKPYVGVNMDLLALEVPATEAALSILQQRRMKACEDGGSHRAGELTPRMLKGNLDQLQADDFTHDPWLELMMASHHATNGEGREEFIGWSTQAAGYSDHDELIGKRWDSFRVSQGGVTVATLFKRVIEAGGTPFDKAEAADDFDEYVPTERELVEKDRWRFISIEELEALPPPRWLVPGILVEGSIAAIYGPPESGKSFLAVDMSMSIASGTPWHGREVVEGGVLYVAGEGAPGLGKRIRAWKLDKGTSDRNLSLSLMRDPINMTTETEARDFARAVTTVLGELRLIVIDTLNQTATGADENSAQDMGKYIASMKLLRDATGAAVVVVHHSGKDETKGMRGSTALLGAMDTTVEVARATDGTSIEVRVRKQKDAERETPIRFNMEKVADSLVLRPTQVADAAADFCANPIREMAREMAEQQGGRVALKVLVAALRERNSVADKTARRRIAESIPEGRENAKSSIDGTVLWLERLDKNPKGEMVVRIEVPTLMA